MPGCIFCFGVYIYILDRLMGFREIVLVGVYTKSNALGIVVGIIILPNPLFRGHPEAAELAMIDHNNVEFCGEVKRDVGGRFLRQRSCCSY